MLASARKDHSIPLTEVHFISEISGVYTSPFLDTDNLKMALRPKNFPGLSRNGLPWVPCPQGINNIIMALIGYIEQLDMGVSNR